MGSGVSTMVWPNDNDPCRCMNIFVSGRRRFVCGMRYVSPYHISRTTCCRGITFSGSYPAGRMTSLRDYDTADAYIPRRDSPLRGSILRYVTMWCLFRRRYVEVIRRKIAPKGEWVIFPVILPGDFFQREWSFLPLLVAGISVKWWHKIPMIYY